MKATFLSIINFIFVCRNTAINFVYIVWKEQSVARSGDAALCAFFA